MIRLALAGFALALTLLLSPAATAGDGDVLLDALEIWSERSLSDLQIPDAPVPYRTVFAAQEHDWYSATAQFGALVNESGHRSRPARVEVVVGDDLRNSARFKARGRMTRVIGKPSLVIDDVSLALQRDLWIVTDGVYKAAVNQYGVKIAALGALGGEPPPADWSAAPPVVATEWDPIEPVDRDRLRAIAVTASERLREVPGLRSGDVQVRSSEGRYVLVTSEGTQLVEPIGYAVVYAWADILRSDGVQIYDRRQWVVRTAADLPSAQEIADEVEAMGRSVLARATAEPVDYYEGPVVFEGEAAADLMRYLVPPEVCGTPPVPEEKRTYTQLTRSGPRLGRRLLPRGWAVVDDPGRALPGLTGGHTYDREGVRGERVSLVDDGYVRDLLMTRVPRKELSTTNGHARGSIQGAWEARLSIWEVTPERNLSTRKFDQEVSKAMKASGIDRILVVRGLQGGKTGSLPRPTDAVWRSADGTEVPVLTLSFQDVDRRALRDIAAAGGGQQTHPYMAAWSLEGKVDGDTGLPMVLISPERLLVEELEAVFPGPADKPHAYPQPILAD